MWDEFRFGYRGGLSQYIKETTYISLWGEDAPPEHWKRITRTRARYTNSPKKNPKKVGEWYSNFSEEELRYEIEDLEEKLADSYRLDWSHELDDWLADTHCDLADLRRELKWQEAKKGLREGKLVGTSIPLRDYADVYPRDLLKRLKAKKNVGDNSGQWEEHRRRDGTVGSALRDEVGPLTVSTRRHEYYPDEEVYQTWILGIPKYEDNFDELSTGKAEARRAHKKGIAHAKAYLAGEGRTIDKGTRVTIIGGRRGKGQSGSVFWTGKNKWGDGDRLGVRGDDGETYWVSDVDAEVETRFRAKENSAEKYVRQGARFRPRVRDRFAEKRERERKAAEEAEKREIERGGKITLYEGQVWTGPGRSHWSTSLEPFGVRDNFPREIAVPLWLAELAEAAKGDTMAEIQFLKWLREEGYIERTR